MIWIIATATLYLLTSGIALFLICSGNKDKDGYFDIRNIGVALVWPLILIGYGLWMLGKNTFKEQPKNKDNEHAA